MLLRPPALPSARRGAVLIASVIVLEDSKVKYVKQIEYSNSNSQVYQRSSSVRRHFPTQERTEEINCDRSKHSAPVSAVSKFHRNEQPIVIESNIVSCALGSETIHLKTRPYQWLDRFTSFKHPKDSKSSSHKEMYTKHDPCICQANILQKEMRKGQYRTFKAKSIQGFIVKTNQSRSKHKYTSKG